MANKIDSQMLKGTLYGCILLLLSKKEMYGYMISDELDTYGFKNISKGTIYPLLLSLERKGVIKGNLKPSIYGPKRKYYSLTKKGIKEKQEFFKEWNQLNSCLTNLIKGVDEYEN